MFARGPDSLGPSSVERQTHRQIITEWCGTSAGGECRVVVSQIVSSKFTYHAKIIVSICPFPLLLSTLALNMLGFCTR